MSTSRLLPPLGVPTAPVLSSTVRLTSLALGADQLFAETVLHCGGRLEVIVPFQGYKKEYAPGPDREKYQTLLSKASRVEVLHWAGSKEESFFAAGKRIVDLCDVLIAVWDGQPAAGLGGTGDVVAYGREKGKAIVHLEPYQRMLHPSLNKVLQLVGTRDRQDDED